MKKLSLILVVAILLVGCQPAASPQPTSIPPTAIPPTQPPSPTPIATPVEVLASSVNDLVGIWIFTLKFEFGANGTFRLYVGSDNSPDMVDEGSYTFDAGKVTFTTSSACKKPATYEAYVTRQDGKPTWLRLQVVGSDLCTGRSDILQRPGKFYAPSISTSVEALAGSVKDLLGVR